MRLGRKAIKTDSRTLKLARYFTSSLPAPPNSRDWTGGQQNWGVFENDILGDCTCAGVGHAIQVFSLAIGKEAVITDIQVRAAYEEWCGYNPKDPETDQGGIELDILGYWRNTSFHGHHIYAYAAVNPLNLIEVRQAINLFGGLYIGLNLPLSAQAQIGGVWDVVPDDGTGNTIPGSWGGHCVFTPAYANTGALTSITWGALQAMTLAFWEKYVDEAYCIVSADFIAKSGIAASGFDLAQLQEDLAAIV